MMFPDRAANLLQIVATLLIALIMTGCASTSNPKDPIEGFNRAMFTFNEGLDKAVLKPVATGYENVMPSPLRLGVTNFFGNIADAFIGANNILQGKIGDGLGDFGRVAINTTIGLLGAFDVATEMGIEKHDEDFGQTLGYWGIGDGPYVVLPLFGPRTTRDIVGLAVDMEVDPVARIEHDSTQRVLMILRLINQRADLLPADKLIDEAALDKYSYLRSAYLQRRRSLIHDGNPPRSADDE